MKLMVLDTRPQQALDQRRASRVYRLQDLALGSLRTPQESWFPGVELWTRFGPLVAVTSPGFVCAAVTRQRRPGFR